MLFLPTASHRNDYVPQVLTLKTTATACFTCHATVLLMLHEQHMHKLALMLVMTDHIQFMAPLAPPTTVAGALMFARAPKTPPHAPPRVTIAKLLL